MIISEDKRFVYNLLKLLRNLLRQSSGQIIHKSKNNSILLLLYFWLMSSSILSWAFTSLLLGSYINKKPSLTAEMLEDVIDNSDLLVASPELKEFDPQLYKILGRRYDKFVDLYPDESSDRHKFVISTRLIEEVKRRKAVIICRTPCKNIIKHFNPNLRVMESEYRYGQRYGYMYFSENMPDRLRLVTMMRSVYQMGILIRDITIIDKVTEIYAKTEPSYTGPEDINAPQSIHFGQALRGPFAILIVGIILSSISFLIELVYSKTFKISMIRNSRKLMRLTNRRFSSLYDIQRHYSMTIFAFQFDFRNVIFWQ